MKVVVKENVRVVIEMRERDFATALNDAKGMVEQIKRHVDGASGHGHYEANPTIDYDVREECSFCHLRWEIDPETGDPACCKSAVAEWHAKHPISAEPKP